MSLRPIIFDVLDIFLGQRVKSYAKWQKFRPIYDVIKTLKIAISFEQDVL